MKMAHVGWGLSNSEDVRICSQTDFALCVSVSQLTTMTIWQGRITYKDTMEGKKAMHKLSM